MGRERRNTLLVGSGLILIVLCYTVFSERGMLKGRQLATQRDAIVARSQILEEQNSQLSHELNNLNNDINTIEKAARSQLDLVRDDEIIYKFVNQPVD